MIAPGGRAAFSVYCDFITDGGGWNVVSINGDIAATASACVHRLRADAPACGTVPSMTADWQLAGALQDTIPFTSVLLYAITDTGTYLAATRLDVGPPRLIGTGSMIVAPVQIGTTALSCMMGLLANRRRVGVTMSGWTVWGVDNVACTTTGGVTGVLGLNVPTGATHDFPGWDDENVAACGCGNNFAPPELGMRRGYYAIR